ncbi:ribonuclease HII [Breznakiella homolactica]|uniref:Ribonuclease HII n=1 Tax=Breznakiella homolactica TaxID=2798577 RepID=A0A7T8BCB5_9SPIR|nr:ribonuclease HII [Breznakiella homolactica]QQO11256.1 ribonuclease HII [Breznakiella homolactica]
MICGLDEAGRGPLAGPVCAAAVLLPDDFPAELLNDSKQLTAPKRERAMAAVYSGALAWGIGWASAAEIDSINILRASLLAMERAYGDMLTRIGKDIAVDSLQGIVDGLHVPEIPIPCTAVVKADGTVPQVMAASILAKTARDRMMERYSWLYPEYGFEKHKGYPTKAHLESIHRHGPSPIQRASFRIKPVQFEMF